MASPTELKAASPLERLVYWMTEREGVRLAREAGGPWPWTSDPLLQTYRFCNVRRMDDVVSRWLMEQWYAIHCDHPSMLKAVAFARFVNLPSSLGCLTSLMFRDGGPDWDGIKAGLAEVKREGGTIFNGAYMVRGNTTKSPNKVATVIDEYVASLDRPGVRVDRKSMEGTWSSIVNNTYGFGSFMAGQVVADLRWAMTGSWADKFKWAPAGPGSMRGLNRLLGQPLKYQWKQSDFLRGLRQTVETLVSLLPGELTGRLEMMDYQNCLCEWDKYERALWGEGKPKQLYHRSRT